MHDAPIAAPSDQYGEETFALRRYILILASRWKGIVLGTVLAAGAGGGLTLAKHTFLPKYESSVDVVLIPTTMTVSFDDSLRTDSDGTDSNADRIARRAAFLGLARSGTVARAVVERLGGQLDEYQNEAELLENIHAELVTIGIQSERNTSNLIRITASADSSALAATIANTWGKEYVVAVNQIFQSVSGPLVTSVQKELDNVKTRYVKAQKNLEEFIMKDKEQQLERAILSREELIENWQTERIKMVDNNHLIWQRLASQLATARVLKAQIGNTGGKNVVSNGLAILLLKANMYASGSGSRYALPDDRALELNLDIANAMHADSTDQAAEVDALIAALQGQIDETQRRTGHLYRLSISSGRFPNEGATESNPGGAADSLARNGENGLHLPAALPSDPREPEGQYHASGEYLPYEIIIKLEDEIRLLSLEKERISQRAKELKTARDLLENSRLALENELIEMSVEVTSGSGSELRLASLAVRPNRPSGPHPVLIAALSGIAGLFIMLCFTFAGDSTVERHRE